MVRDKSTIDLLDKFEKEVKGNVRKRNVVSQENLKFNAVYEVLSLLSFIDKQILKRLGRSQKMEDSRKQFKKKPGEMRSEEIVMVDDEMKIRTETVG